MGNATGPRIPPAAFLWVYAIAGCLQLAFAAGHLAHHRPFATWWYQLFLGLFMLLGAAYWARRGRRVSPPSSNANTA
jgi:hypothetical protein